MQINEDHLSGREAPDVDAIGKVGSRGDLFDPTGAIDGCIKDSGGQEEESGQVKDMEPDADEADQGDEGDPVSGDEQPGAEAIAKDTDEEIHQHVGIGIQYKTGVACLPDGCLDGDAEEGADDCQYYY